MALTGFNCGLLAQEGPDRKGMVGWDDLIS